jgi:hypothetical protein
MCGSNIMGFSRDASQINSGILNEQKNILKGLMKDKLRVKKSKDTFVEVYPDMGSPFLKKK